MKMRNKHLASTFVALSALGWSAASHAQVDINPPAPNVLFLVDTSGSMEYLSSSSNFPACNPTGAGSQKSRWIDLVEVMTGSVNNYRCQSVDRSSTQFRQEYDLNGQPIYDYQYTNPFHRILSGTCTPAPNNNATIRGQLASNPYSYPDNWLRHRNYLNLAGACDASGFNQSADGLIDTYRGRVRFGLMTFDTHTDAGTGLSGTSGNFQTGMDGTWSYFVGGSKAGRPAGCAESYPQEVGARNAAAPPWEGRMVAFGAPTADSTEMNRRADWIQNVLLTTRPYGATPIAGMLSDAADFLFNESQIDPLHTGGGAAPDFGPRADPYITQGCRKTIVVLLTDGEPNLDLRPFCESGTGQCPYDRVETIATEFKTRGVPVFVVGFAVNDVKYGPSATPLDCSDLDLSSGGSASICADNPTDRELQVCCTLSRIAYHGGTQRAYFPADREQLRSALSNILAQMVPSTSRTLPVFAATGNVRNDFAGSYRVLSSFTPAGAITAGNSSLWSGVLERQRVVCEAPANPTDPIEPIIQAIDETKGDDFVANVNSKLGAPRQFFSVRADTVSGTGEIRSNYSVRPRVTSDDGIGVYQGIQYNGTDTNFVSATQAAAMGITNTTCSGLPNQAQCKDRILRWTVGLDNGTEFSRCSGGECNLMADIYHSTPRVVGRPSEFIRDESYDQFALEQVDRPLVLYTSTNDGFLHAFDMNVETKTNNEIWAFVPPAVLPALPTQYPGSHKRLLDGVPVVRDVVATEDGTNFKLERNAGQAQSGTGRWRSILVQSFGMGNNTAGGYYALDITDPVPSADGTKGPKFLWQLTTTNNGQALFGSSTPTPLITTLYFTPRGESAPKEIAVAVLPGGDAGGRTAANCNRTLNATNTSYPPRASVKCYDAAANAARSLTIVRLDTGEIIRTFRPEGLAPGGLLGDEEKTTVTPIQSPISGQPVAFPGDTGTVADRIFVGDRDGGLWRIDTSKTNPKDWTMSFFWDAFPNNLGFDGDDGQPIMTPPVLSVDSLGQITVAFSTGDQDSLTASTQSNFVWSITETVAANGSTLGSKANWFVRLNDAERVAGPLSLFNGSLFFSTFKPEPPTSANVCRVGNSRVWGMDYLLPMNTDLSQGGMPRLPEDPSATAPTLVQYIDNTSALLQDGATIFGVGVAQLPSCNEVDGSFNDPYMGYGAHRSISNVNPGTFQLVMHTGSAGTSASGGKTNTLSFDLPVPPAIATIDSWAALVEGL